MENFEHIPVEEKQKQWFLLLSPLLEKRKLHSHFETSPLAQALIRENGPSSWKIIKVLIEKVVQNVKNGNRIFDRCSEVENDPKPDNPITDMFAECRAALYLLQKGFYDLTYFRQNNVDFEAKFDDEIFYVEVTYLHGPDFKIFGDSNPKPNLLKPGETWDYSRKLKDFLKAKYSNKEKQFLNRNLHPNKCLVLMVTDLMETHEPWFDHIKINGIHPIQYFVNTQNIATVLYGSGSVYEPDPAALDGKFGKLNKFSWDYEKYS
jgi:hypothetical protein